MNIGFPEAVRENGTHEVGVALVVKIISTKQPIDCLSSEHSLYLVVSAWDGILPYGSHLLCQRATLATAP